MARRMYRDRFAPVVATAFVVGALSAAGIGLGAGAAGAAPITVTNIADSGADSLRDVLENDISDGAIVELTAGATYTLAGCTNGEIDISADVTIVGNGATIQQDGGCAGVLRTEHSLSLDGVTIRGGFAEGGGVSSSGSEETLVIVNSTFTDNVSGDDGSAIDARGAVTIVGSTFAGNTADNEGTIRVINGGSLLVVNSTITGNTGGFGSFAAGGISTRNGTDATIVYSTVVGNQVVEDPVEDEAVADAADDQDLVMGMPDQTAAANIRVTDESALAAFGTVVALPTGADNCLVEGGLTDSAGYNYSDDDSCSFDAATDEENGGDPLLGALAGNGGPTQTRLPQPGSPLLNRIPVAACAGGDLLVGDLAPITTDQRGVVRPQETGCEIGAVEVEPAPAPVEVTPTFTG